MLTLSIASSFSTLDFTQASQQAVAKACVTLTEPVIVDWEDATTVKSAPEIPGGSADRWHDGACTEAYRERQGFFAGGGLGG
jgi:hypothetical protein